MRHKQPCENCTRLLEVANIVIDKGFIQLKKAFEIACPDVADKSTIAKRKLLQMPVASVAVGLTTKITQRVFVVEKQNHVKYDSPGTPQSIVGIQSYGIMLNTTFSSHSINGGNPKPWNHLVH